MTNIITNAPVRVSPSAFCIEDNTAWVVHASLNIFFSYDLTNGYTKTYRLSPYGELYKESQFCGIHSYNNKVYFVPCYSQQILCFDCETEKIMVLEENNTYGRFSCSYIINNYLYCVPFREDDFIKIDMNNNEIKYIPWRGSQCCHGEYINSAFEYNGKIIGMTSSENCVLVLEEDNVKYVITKTEHEVFSTGCIFHNEIFLYSGSTKQVFGFENLLNSPIETFPMIDGGGAIKAIGNNYLLMENVDLNGSIWIKADRKQKFVSEDSESIKGVDYSYNHGLVTRYGDRDFYYNRRKNIIIEYQNGEEVNKYCIYFSKKIIEEVFFNILNEQKIISETEVFGVREFIDLI